MKPGVPSNNSYLGERADVVGAGLAGISAARVVFDYFSDAAGHNIKDIPWKKSFQPSTNSFVSPNESVSPNGRDCITYRKRYDTSPVAGPPDAFWCRFNRKQKGIQPRTNDEPLRQHLRQLRQAPRGPQNPGL
jgi:hypothetical protein